MRRLIFPVILGVGGVAILLWLAFWQLHRLEWKTDILAQIDARIGAVPIALPDEIDPQEHKYLPVEVIGTFTGERIFVLTSYQDYGPGFRVIESFEPQGLPRIMVDRGFVPESQRDAITSGAVEQLIGNLHWPQEIDGWTPEPDGDLWFARDVEPMAAALQVEPILIVARDILPDDPVIYPAPIDSAGISNDHQNYAITWFLLALVWAVMSGFFAWRIWQAPKKESI